ncbi:AKC2 [Auxenochlorella protothecoides x Auxenochlorella symbiontica]
MAVAERPPSSDHQLAPHESQAPLGPPQAPSPWWEAASRSSRFWARASSIYAGYKVAQVRAQLLKASGWSPDRITAEHWEPHHAAAGEAMHDLCILLRGFYLKAGQFIGARGDFVPGPICKRLARLQDQVPPMSPDRAASLIQAELGGAPLTSVFAWIDLERPLGSASVAQVHKARLACPPSQRGRPLLARLGEWVWKPRRGRTAPSPALLPGGADMCLACAAAPRDGVVAVKIQYPDALNDMTLDLANLRRLSSFLSKTEIDFDLVSAVDELAAQIRLEFDFRREARVMDAVADQFKHLGHKIKVPHSIPGLVTDRMIVMEFLDGIPITRLAAHTSSLSASTRRLAAGRVLDRVSEAYGRMILLDGLFQADCHPGNILVMKGGTVGLIDYGQSKKLPDSYRALFARLILALHREDEAGISAALRALGVETQREDPPLASKLAYGMFDTRGKVDPFDPDSPIKKLGVSRFPKDLFFVMRVVQLLRGLASGMELKDFSSATQWEPLALEALANLPAAAQEHLELDVL